MVLNASSGQNSIICDELLVDVDVVECINNNFVVESILIKNSDIKLAFDTTGKTKEKSKKIRKLK